MLGCDSVRPEGHDRQCVCVYARERERERERERIDMGAGLLCLDLFSSVCPKYPFLIYSITGLPFLFLFLFLFLFKIKSFLYLLVFNN